MLLDLCDDPVSKSPENGSIPKSDFQNTLTSSSDEGVGSLGCGDDPASQSTSEVVNSCSSSVPRQTLTDWRPKKPNGEQNLGDNVNANFALYCIFFRVNLISIFAFP